MAWPGPATYPSSFLIPSSTPVNIAEVKANGDSIEGPVAVPTNYPNPVTQNINMHSASWAATGG